MFHLSTKINLSCALPTPITWTVYIVFLCLWHCSILPRPLYASVLLSTLKDVGSLYINEHLHYNDFVMLDCHVCIQFRLLFWPFLFQVFSGNSDRNTVVRNAFHTPLVCRFVRVRPVTWHRHISVRMELYGHGPLEVNEGKWNVQSCINHTAFKYGINDDTTLENSSRS